MIHHHRSDVLCVVPEYTNNSGKKVEKPVGAFGLFLLSVVIGVIASFGAVFFRALIGFFHNILFLGRLSFVYDANVHTPPSIWGPLVILVPVAGAAGVTFLVKNFAPETKGHGVPEVMHGIYYEKGFIRPVVVIIKAFASALSIGSGASIGREGPIIQIGAALGSSLARIFALPAWQRITIIAAGAGGGIAATFNTPLGGVLFAVEILLHEVSVRTLVPVAISTATATYLGRIFFGAHPSFVIPSFEQPFFKLTDPVVLLSYVGLGVIMGVASAAYIRSIYGFEDLFERRIPGGAYFRHMFGMLLSGLIMYLLFITTGHYYIEGVGYATVQEILTGTLAQVPFLLLLFCLKLLATSLALGSGASGGVFSPALFMGATLGAAYGDVLHNFFPGLDISPPAFAVAGMAGLVGGATGAAIASIIMIMEMTYDYSVVIPLTITVALSYGVRSLLSKESIYTMKLARRGHYLPGALHSNVHRLKRSRDIMEVHFAIVPAALTLTEFASSVDGHGTSRWYILEDGASIAGVTTRDSGLAALVESGGTRLLREAVNTVYVIVGDDVTLTDVLARLENENAAVALVVREVGPATVANVTGVIDKEMIADAMGASFEFFSDYR
ncbi:MAG: chloride channel protein [Geobacter sp.]|nr:MAG: chloride channel protein [Geobacter sp.]